MRLTCTLVAVIVMVLNLCGCTTTGSVYVDNDSDQQIAIAFDSGDVRIPPGSTTVVEGLQNNERIEVWYDGGAATYSRGLSILRPESAFFNGRYYCIRLFGVRMDITFTDRRELLLEPCSRDDARIPLGADHGTRLVPEPR